MNMVSTKVWVVPMFADCITRGLRGVIHGLLHSEEAMA